MKSAKNQREIYFIVCMQRKNNCKYCSQGEQGFFKKRLKNDFIELIAGQRLAQTRFTLLVKETNSA